jgi:glutamine---fructose-6-phosphate transaminase (isomerizing)
MVNRLDEGIEKLTQLSSLIDENMTFNYSGLDRLALKLKDNKDFYFLGRGINFAIATEGALKLKEIAYVHAEGMSAGELKHGTLALIEPGMPVVGICPRDYTFDEMMSNVLETRARGSFVIGVSDKPDAAFDEWVHIPAVEEIFYPLVSVIPLQLLAYYSALARGFDPDKPRNLAKSVTVK